MAGSLNRAQLIGNLGRDPEIRTMQNGNKVANLSLATSESWKDKQTGERKERSDWHRIVVFNDHLIGVIEKYAKKGMKVFVEGQIQTRKFQNQSGADQYTTEIVLSGFGGTFTMLSDGRGGGKDEDENQDAGQQQSGGSGGGGDLDDIDQIPF
jgi:single-strand DNA-binding protein